MIDPSSSEEESDDDRKKPVAVAHSRGHLQSEPPSSTPKLDKSNTPQHHSRSFSPGSTNSPDTLSVGQPASQGSHAGSASIGGTPTRGGGTNLPRPTSPSPSPVSEQTVTDSIDPAV